MPSFLIVSSYQSMPGFLPQQRKRSSRRKGTSTYCCETHSLNLNSRSKNDVDIVGEVINATCASWVYQTIVSHSHYQCFLNAIVTFMSLSVARFPKSQKKKRGPSRRKHGVCW